MKRLVVAALFALIGGSAAMAEPARLLCGSDDFITDNPMPDRGRINGAGNVHLQNDELGCPSDGGGCDRKAYVVPGDLVLMGIVTDDYTCVFIPHGKGGSTGYVPTARIAPLPAYHPALADWAGEWRQGDDVIRLSVKGNTIAVDADAYPPSAHGKPNPKSAGHFAAAVAPDNNYVLLDGKVGRQDCILMLTLEPEGVLANDNLSCGTANASYHGQFLKAK